MDVPQDTVGYFTLKRLMKHDTAMPPPSDHDSLFTELDCLLTRHRDLWQVRAFHHRHLYWRDSRPDLCAALQGLDDSRLDELERDERALNEWLIPWLGQDGDALAHQARLPELPQRPLPIPPRLDTGVPGRKWAQIRALAGTLPDDRRPLLEWCSGKGHLGRLLALADGRPVTSLERDETLCKAGREMAASHRASQRFVQADVLDPDSAQWLPANGQALALHACGDLHTTLIRHWIASDCQRLTLSPCCYHLIATDTYRPLSRQAAASALRLNHIDLQWAVRQLTTGGFAAGRLRHTELWWRLAFDEWQRHLRNEDAYLPLPTFPKGLLSGSFGEFCRWAVGKKGLESTATIDEAYWLARGNERLRRVRLAELMGRPFQRPLELWLVLDRALFLEEHGARVRIGTFCDHQLTPRNIVIDAERPAA